MKKIISLMLTALVAATLVLALASCSVKNNKLSGTYEGNGISLTFSGDAVTVEITEHSARYRLVGGYEIEDNNDKESIKFTFKDIDAEDITDAEIKVLEKLYSFGDFFTGSKKPLYRENNAIRIGILQFDKK